MELSEFSGDYRRYYQMAVTINNIEAEKDNGIKMVLPIPFVDAVYHSQMKNQEFVSEVQGKVVQKNGLTNPYLSQIGKRLKELPKKLVAPFRKNAEGRFVFYHRTKASAAHEEILAGNAFPSIGDDSVFGGAASWGDGFYVAPNLSLTGYGHYIVNVNVSSDAVVGKDIDFFIGQSDGLIAVIKRGAIANLEVESDREWVIQRIKEATATGKYELAIQLLETQAIINANEFFGSAKAKIHPLLQFYFILRDARESELPPSNVDPEIKNYFKGLQERPEFATRSEAFAINALIMFYPMETKPIADVFLDEKTNILNLILEDLSTYRATIFSAKQLPSWRAHGGNSFMENRVLKGFVNFFDTVVRLVESNEIRMFDKIGSLSDAMNILEDRHLAALFNGDETNRAIIDTIHQGFEKLANSFESYLARSRNSPTFWQDMAEFMNLSLQRPLPTHPGYFAPKYNKAYHGIYGTDDKNVMILSEIGRAFNITFIQRATLKSLLGGILPSLPGAASSKGYRTPEILPTLEYIDALKHFYEKNCMGACIDATTIQGEVQKLPAELHAAAYRSVFFASVKDQIAAGTKVDQGNPYGNLTTPEWEAYSSTIGLPPCDRLKQIMERHNTR